MNDKVSVEIHNRLITAAKRVLLSEETTPTVASVYRLAGVSKATAYRDREFLDWWKNEQANFKGTTIASIEQEVVSLRRQIEQLLQEQQSLRHENELARTVIAAQARTMANQGSSPNKIVHIETGRDNVRG